MIISLARAATLYIVTTLSLGARILLYIFYRYILYKIKQRKRKIDTAKLALGKFLFFTLSTQ